MTVRAISLCLILFAGISCSDQESVFTPTGENWIAPFDPIEFGDTLIVELEVRSYERVGNDRIGDAIAKLGRSSFAEIPYSELSSYLSSLDSVEDDASAKAQIFLLVRSCFFTNHDIAHLYFDGTTLLHTVDNRGVQKVPMQRSAIVVSLARLPDDYQFNCSLAQ